MIESAYGYKFRDHIVETILYEDQVVEHYITGYIAQRRVFPKRMNQDEVAVQAIKEQVRLSTTISHPNVPSIINAGMHADQYVIIQQYSPGESLDLIAQRKHAATPKEWKPIARRFVRMLASLQLNGIAFDRISLRDVMYNKQLILVGSRYPVGVTASKDLDKSAYLQRLFESQTSGIYHVQGRFPVDECLVSVKNLLFQLASSNQQENVDSALAIQLERMRDSGQAKIYSALGISHPIEEIILRLHNQSDSNAIRSLDDLIVAIEKMDTSTRSSVEMPIGLKQSKEQSGKSETKFAPDFAQPSSPSRASKESNFVPPTVNRPSSRTAVKTPSQSDAPSTTQNRQMIGQISSTDVEEDRSYLYPKGPKADAHDSADSVASSKSPSAINDSLDSIKLTKAKQPISIPVIPIFTVVILLIVGFVGYNYIPVLFLKKENNPPVAVITPLDGLSGKTTSTLNFSGADSSDPDEGTSLAYRWSLKNPDLDPTDYLLKSANGSSSDISLSIFKVGTYTLELIVFDGSLNSEPQQLSITIESGF